MNFNTWYSQNGSSYVYNNTLTNVYETRIRYKLNSQDIADKSSNVTIQLQCRSINSSWRTYGYTQVPTIMGIALSGKTFDMRNTNVWQTFGEQTLDLKHNDDGTLKTTLTASFVTNVSTTGSLHKGNASVEVEFPTLHTPPTVNNVTITEKNQALIDAGISNTQFISNLSIKQFDFDYTLYDDANANEFSILQKINDVAYWNLSLTKNEEPIIVDFSQPGDNSSWVAPYPNAFRFIVKDSLGAYGYIDKEYETFIPYFKPILSNTETKVKRVGQTSGRVLLNTKGQYFNGNIGNLLATIKVFYKYWAKGTTEPTQYIQIPNENITVDGNNFTITDYLIGSNLDFENAYNISIYIQDNFNQTEPISKSIPVGESVWTEYKDRVDFKNITIKGKQVAKQEDIPKIKIIQGKIVATGTYAKGTYITVGETEIDTTDTITVEGNETKEVVFESNGLITLNYVGLIKINLHLWVRGSSTSSRPWIYIYDYTNQKPLAEWIDDVSSLYNIAEINDLYIENDKIGNQIGIYVFDVSGNITPNGGSNNKLSYINLELL